MPPSKRKAANKTNSGLPSVKATRASAASASSAVLGHSELDDAMDAEPSGALAMTNALVRGCFARDRRASMSSGSASGSQATPEEVAARQAALKAARDALLDGADINDTVRTLAQTFGVGRPEQSTLRALHAVLDKIEQPSKYRRDQDAFGERTGNPCAFPSCRDCYLTTVGDRFPITARLCGSDDSETSVLARDIVFSLLEE